MCGCGRAGCASEALHTFGLPAMGVLRVAAGERALSQHSTCKTLRCCPALKTRRLARLLVFLSISTKNSRKLGLSSPCSVCPGALRWDLSKTIETETSLPSFCLLKMRPSCSEQPWAEEPHEGC